MSLLGKVLFCLFVVLHLLNTLLCFMYFILKHEWLEQFIYLKIPLIALISILTYFVLWICRLHNIKSYPSLIEGIPQD